MSAPAKLAAATPRPSAGESAMREGWAAQTNACLQQLPAAQQNVLRLLYQHNRSWQDVSELLHLPVAAVRQLVTAGLANLAAALLIGPAPDDAVTTTHSARQQREIG